MNDALGRGASPQPVLPPAPRIAVVVPCYRVRRHVLDVLAAVPARVADIICVDDACPEGSGDLIERECDDPRVRVIRHTSNGGVGAAMVTGYRAALEADADIIVKLDGDGQMDPCLIDRFVAPIASGHADYTKGNRFYRLETVQAMPAARLFGNAVLSFMSKLSTGYWQIFDPNNGFTAIDSSVLRLMPLERLARGYFFESDMLFRLNTVRAVVVDIPMNAVYGDESSSLRVSHAALHFSGMHARNFIKRILYNYFLRDFNLTSLHWVFGPTMLVFGLVFGLLEWRAAVLAGVTASAGTVMLAALPTIAGLQLTLTALAYDINNRPTVPLHRLLRGRG